MYQLWAVGLLFAAGTLLHFAPAASQPYPSRPVRIVVPTVPSGAADTVARHLAQQLTETWRAQVVVDNRPGPGGKIGADVVAKAPPDGHTLLFGSTSLATSPALYRKVQYDAARDFVAVAGISHTPFLLLADPSLAAGSVKALIALAKVQPDRMRYGCSAPGMEDHLCGELFEQMAGIRAAAMHHKGADAVTLRLLSGEVEYVFASMPTALAHVKSGKAYPLAITSSKRHPVLPELPSVSETLPGFECASWQALFVPSKTPVDVRRTIEAVLVKLVRSKETDELLAAEGHQLYLGNSDEFGKLFRAELLKWAKVIKEAGVKPL